MISRTRHMEGFGFCFLFPGIWPLKASCARAEAETPFQVSLLKLPQHSLKKWWQINKFSDDKSEHQVLNLLISLLCPHMKTQIDFPGSLHILSLLTIYSSYEQSSNNLMKAVTWEKDLGRY